MGFNKGVKIDTLKSFQVDKGRTPHKSIIKSLISELRKYGDCYAPNKKDVLKAIKNMFPSAVINERDYNQVEIYLPETR